MIKRNLFLSYRALERDVKRSYLFLLLSVCSLTQAAEFVVDDTQDLPDEDVSNTACAAPGGGCTLRAAVEQANQTAGPHTIVLQAQTYTLSYELDGRVRPLVIDSICAAVDSSCPPGSTRIAIRGVGESTTTIRLADEGNGRLVYVAPRNVVEISDSTLADGNLDAAENAMYPGGGGGGAIRIARGATVVLSGTRIENNRVERSHGGAIRNSGTLYISDSTIASNRYIASPIGGYGGAIFHTGEYAGISNTVIEDNTAILGGGVYVGYTNESAVLSDVSNSAPRLEIGNSMIRGNQASERGGGLYDAGSFTTLTNVSFLNNSARRAGGGIYATGASVFYPAFADTTDREQDGLRIFANRESDEGACGVCHGNFGGEYGFTPNNGRYSDYGLVNKILHSMPPSDPTVCGIRCAVDVMTFLRLPAIPYELAEATNPHDNRSSDWYGARELEIRSTRFEGNSAPEGNHCSTQPAAWVTPVTEQDVIVVPEGGSACVTDPASREPPAPPTNLNTN